MFECTKSRKVRAKSNYFLSFLRAKVFQLDLSLAKYRGISQHRNINIFYKKFYLFFDKFLQFTRVQLEYWKVSERRHIALSSADREIGNNFCDLTKDAA